MAIAEASRIPVVLCIDVEPDARDIDLNSPPPWLGFARTHALLEPFRRLAAARTSREARFSWYLRMDPQIALGYGSASWVAESHAALLDVLRATGDEVGLHVHPYRWDAQRRTWIIDCADAAWIDNCLTMAFSAFEASMGPCRTFRFGDHWMNQRTFERLEALGVEVDLTLEPGHDNTSFYGPSEPFTGTLPDYRRMPSFPYHPSAHDYLRADAQKRTGIWELPVTTASVQPHLPHRLYRRWVSGRPETGASTALVSMAPSLFSRIIEDAISRPRPCLVLALRAGASMSPLYAARINANLSALLKRPEVSRFAWVTPGSAIQLLQG